MKIAVIVQARMNSTRLPGKVLEPLGEATALERCLHRCMQIPGADAVVCATPSGIEDDEVAAAALRAGAFVVRGSEEDVLARYALAAKAVKADYVMRVTSDCPFADPALCGEVADLFFAENAEYGCNNMPALFPHGLDCEIFSADALFKAAREDDDQASREHVTAGMRRRAGGGGARLIGPGGGVERLRWTLDAPADLTFFRAVFASMGEAAARASWRELAAFCGENPEISNINAHLVDERRLQAAPAIARA